MNLPTSRRHFLQAATTTSALLGLGDLSFLSRLPRVSRAAAQMNPKSVRFQSEIEPLVRLLEETPRERFQLARLRRAGQRTGQTNARGATGLKRDSQPLVLRLPMKDFSFISNTSPVI